MMIILLLQMPNKLLFVPAQSRQPELSRARIPPIRFRLKNHQNHLLKTFCCLRNSKIRIQLKVGFSETLNANFSATYTNQLCLRFDVRF